MFSPKNEDASDLLPLFAGNGHRRSNSQGSYEPTVVVAAAAAAAAHSTQIIKRNVRRQRGLASKIVLPKKNQFLN